MTTLKLAAAAAVPGGQADDSPLSWSLASVSEALRRLAAAAETPQAVAAATEAVWWITTADAALNRHHPGPYGRALAALDPAARRAVERSLAGLRFIRGQLGYRADPADFIKAQPAPGSSGGTPAAAWTWSLLPPPSPQRAAEREASPYREHRAQLAGRALAEALNLSAGFLVQAHAAPDRHRGISAPAR